LVSTTTVLERPWLKLCLTMPELTAPGERGFRVRGARVPEGADPLSEEGLVLSFSSVMRSLDQSAGSQKLPA
jgi:hypothetical protein